MEKISIEELVQKEKYDDIYKLYGRDKFLEYAPNSYQKDDILDLLCDGRFYFIYEKYGAKTYQEWLFKMIEDDVLYETGNRFLAKNEVFKYRWNGIVKNLRDTCVTMAFIVTASMQIGFSKNIYDNKKAVATELSDYNDYNKKYASYINSLGLNDLETVIKVMYDMWDGMYFYLIPPENYDKIGINRLSIYEYGVGVCRNMADDMTAKLNAINKSYDATNLIVNMTTTNGVDCNNIKRKFLEISSDNETNNETSNEEEKKDESFFTNPNLVGNHMVSCFYVKENNVIMIADPTNSLLGIMKNGKIYLFQKNGDGKLEIKYFGNIIYGTDKKLNEIYIKSFFTNGDIDTLDDLFGIDMQNEAIDKVKKYSFNNKK